MPINPDAEYLRCRAIARHLLASSSLFSRLSSLPDLPDLCARTGRYSHSIALTDEGNIDYRPDRGISDLLSRTWLYLQYLNSCTAMDYVSGRVAATALKFAVRSFSDVLSYGMLTHLQDGSFDVLLREYYTDVLVRLMLNNPSFFAAGPVLVQHKGYVDWTVTAHLLEEHAVDVDGHPLGRRATHVDDFDPNRAPDDQPERVRRTLMCHSGGAGMALDLRPAIAEISFTTSDPIANHPAGDWVQHFDGVRRDGDEVLVVLPVLYSATWLLEGRSILLRSPHYTYLELMNSLEQRLAGFEYDAHDTSVLLSGTMRVLSASHSFPGETASVL